MPNQIIGGAKAKGIIGGWRQLFKGGFDEHSTQGQRGKMYINLILSLVKEVKKEDEEEEVEGLPSYVRAKEVGRGGLVSRSWNNQCLLIRL